MEYVAEGKERLDRFLAGQMPEHSRAKLVRAIEDGQVRVNGQEQRSSYSLHQGDVVEVDDIPERAVHDLTPANIPLDVVYEDDDLAVVNKPRGLATHPAATLHEPTLVNALLGRAMPLSGTGEGYRPGIVHRLDKETTGLLVVAKNDRAHVHLQGQIASRSAERRYVAGVMREIERERFTLDGPLAVDPKYRTRRAVVADGKPAITHVKRLARTERGTLIACRLQTGRTHQIRVHLSSLGHPVLGDGVYGGPTDMPLQLHAAFLRIAHPTTGEEMAFFSVPPSDFLAGELVHRADLEVW